MCSRDPEDDALMKPKEKRDLLGAHCRKCDVAKASVVLQNKFPYCRNCFLAYFTHKFQATLGKSKIMKHGDKVLLAFSGSSSSMCLLDLVKCSMDESRRKKINTTTVLLYIEEGLVFDKTLEERTEILNEIYNSVLLYNFKTFCTSYEGFFSEDIMLHTKASTLLEEEKSNQMEQLLYYCSTQTAKIDLLTKARNTILAKAARALQCNKIFLADTSDHLAVNIISNISMGRGSQLALDTGFCDDRFEDVLIVKPLQDCSKKEVAYYNKFNDLSSVVIPSFGTMDDKFSSIQKLTETFVSELLCSFPSTVSTVVATGNKLVTNRNDEGFYCCLCQAKIEGNDKELSAEHATTISSLVSKLGLQGFESETLKSKPMIETDNVEELCDSSCSPTKNDCNCTKGSNTLTKEMLNEVLCYGCRLILKDCKNIESWPSFIKMKAQEKNQLKAMEHEIKDFLL